MHYNHQYRENKKQIPELKLEKLQPFDLEKALSFLKFVEYDQKDAENYKRPKEDSNGTMSEVCII